MLPELQRIHPAPIGGDAKAPPAPKTPPIPPRPFRTEKGGDAEAPPTDPLVPPRLFKSGKSDPVLNHHPPLPSPSTIPVMSPKRRSKRSCCFKIICWCAAIFFLLLIAFAASGGILYLVFQPKVPKYSINSLRIANLRLNSDATLYAEFDIKIKAYNPNKKIGIYYKKGGSLSVWYQSTQLSRGSVPSFYQGHQNTTVMDVVLSGDVQYGRALLRAMQVQQQMGSSIPLDLKVDVPVAIKLGRLKLRKVRFLVRCKLTADSLTTNNLISIRTNNCRFKPKL